MTWTYSGDPSSSDLDYVRFGIGDTDITNAFLTDEEIGAMLTETPNRDAVKLLCMESVLLKLSRECDYKIGPEQVSASQRYENYFGMYTKLFKKLSNQNISPQIINTSDATSADYREPIFTIGMDDSVLSTSDLLGG